MTKSVRAALSAALFLGTAITTADAADLKVVTTFSILGDMIAEIGGDRVEVTTLVGPDGDAHVYQPTPSDARTVAEADLVVVNGLGFEGFLDRLLEASGYKGAIVTAAAAVSPIVIEDEDEDYDHEGEDAEHHDEEVSHEEAGHHHHGTDPHAWQDLSNGMSYVTAITDGLCAADASGCDDYRRRASAYGDELKALDGDIRARISAIPEARRVVVSGHDAFGYFSRAYGVRFIAPQGVSTESEASAKDVAALVEQIRALGVKTVFTETISDPRLVEAIAAETGAEVSGVLRSDALSPPGEAGDTYLGMMRVNADALIGAMLKGS